MMQSEPILAESPLVCLKKTSMDTDKINTVIVVVVIVITVLLLLVFFLFIIIDSR